MSLLEALPKLISWTIPLIILAVIILPQAIRILREYERGVIFRLGKLLGAKGPGLIFLIPIVDRMVRMDLRVVTINVERQEVMTREMAKQAEAERERRAKIVNAEGEFQAAEKMVQAAAMMSKEPIALQLRFLQTMREIASEHNTTTFLPVPIDLFGSYKKGEPPKS